jgi:hypothetical protein
MRIIPENSYKRDAIETEITEDLTSWCGPGTFLVLARITWDNSSSRLGTPDFHSRPNIVTGIVGKGNAERHFASSAIIGSGADTDIYKSNLFVSAASIVSTIAEITVRAEKLFVSSPVIRAAIVSDADARRELAAQADISSDIDGDIYKINLFVSAASISSDISSDFERQYHFISAPSITFSITGDVIFGGRFASGADIVSDITDPNIEYYVGTTSSPAIQTSIISVGLAERIFASQADIQTGYLSSTIDYGWAFAAQADIVSDITAIIEISSYFVSSPSIGTDISSDANAQREFGSSASIVSGTISDIGTQEEIEFVSSPSIVTAATSAIDKGISVFESVNNPIILTIDSSQIDEDLTDFPVMINLSAASGINDADLTALFDDLAWTGDDFSNLDNWTKFGIASNVFVSDNVLTVRALSGGADNEIHGCYSKFRLDQSQDYEITVDFTMTAPSTNAFYADMLVNFKEQTGDPYGGAWDTLVFSRRSYNSGNGGHVWQSLAAEDGSFKTTDTDVNTTMSGKLRQVKIGNDISCYYDAGSGWVLSQTYSFTDFDNEDGHVNFMISKQNAVNVTFELSNFAVVVGNVIWPAATDPNRKKISVQNSSRNTEYNVEIANWNAATKTASLHAKIPSVLAASDTVLNLLYDSTKADNTDYIGDIGDTPAQAVWDSDFVTVYHMTDAILIPESTGNNQDADATGTPDLVDGLKSIKAVNLSGSDEYFSAGSGAILDDIALMTVESVFKADNLGQNNSGRIVDKTVSPNNGWSFLVHSSGLVVVRDSSGGVGQWYNSDALITDGNTWYHGAFTHDKSSINNDPIVYLNGDGSNQVESTAPSGTWDSDAPATTKIGIRDGGDREFDGLIGEIRISKMIRSAAWLKATYHTFFDTLITYALSALDYANRIELVIDKSNIDEDLTDFPVMINLSDSAIGNGDITEVFDALAYTGDDFTGEDGASPDTDLWDVEDDDSVTSIQNNKFEFDASAIASPQIIARIIGKFQATGDFDVSVDFTADQFTQPPGTHYCPSFQAMRVSDDVNIAQIARVRSASLNQYRAYGLNEGGAYKGPADAFGKLRLTRISGVIRSFYWTDTAGGQWEWDGNTAGIIVANNGPGSTEDVYFRFYWEQESGEDVQGTIDNFVVNSGTLIWAPGTHPNRKKIAVTRADGLSECPVEIIHWDNANEKAELWVKVPEILAGTDTKLFLYFDSDHADNPNVGDTGEASAQAVWDDDFVAVYHMAQDPSLGTLKDSTSYDHDMTVVNMESSDLVIDEDGIAYNFGGSNEKAYIVDNAALSLLTDFSVETVFKLTGTPSSNQNIFNKMDANINGWGFQVNGSGEPLFGFKQSLSIYTYYKKDVPDYAVDAKNYFGFYYPGDGSDVDIFWNDTNPTDWSRVDAATPCLNGIDDSEDDLKIGHGQVFHSSEYFMTGKVFECRYSKAQRSAAWAKATYHTCFDTLMTFNTAAYTQGFANQIELTIDSSQIDEDLTDFPVMINLSTASGITSGNTTEVFDALAWTGDDFTGADGDLVEDGEIWTFISGVSGELEIQNNTLYFNFDQNSGYRQTIIDSKFVLSGDFEVQMNFNIASSDPTSAQHYMPRLAIRNLADAPIGFISRSRKSGNNGYYAYGLESGFVWDNMDDSIGQFKITRISGSVKVYYWDTDDWKWNGSTAGLEVEDSNTEDAVIELLFEQETTGTYYGFVDDLLVTADSIEWPNGHPNRKKLAVTTADGTQCKIEIENFDSINEQISLWVKIPSILAASDTILNFRYDASIVDNIYVGDIGDTPAQAVWDSNFKAVHHMAQDPSGGAGCMLDSTSFGNDGTPQDGMASNDLVDGVKSAKALDFNTQWMNYGDNVSLDITGKLTLEALGKRDAGAPNSTMYMARDIDPGNRNYYLFLNGVNDRITFGVFTSTTLYNCHSNDSIIGTDWQYVAGVYNKIDLRTYVDGALNLASGPTAHTGDIDNTDVPLTAAGRSTPDLRMVGLLGEIRLSDIDRSAAWLKATYYTLFDTLMTYDVIIPDDDFSGAEINTDRWTVIGQAANVTQTGGYLQCTVDSGDVSLERQGVLSNFELDSTEDFEVIIELDIPAGPATNSWMACVSLTFQDQIGQPDDPLWDTGVIARRRYGGGAHEFQSLAIEDTAWKTTDTDADSTLTGIKYRIKKVNNIITEYYDIGSGWVTQGAYTFTDFDDKHGRISLHVANVDSQPTATVRFTNFTVVSGTVHWWK